jgi:hypothetical protein
MTRLQINLIARYFGVISLVLKVTIVVFAVISKSKNNFFIYVIGIIVFHFATSFYDMTCENCYVMILIHTYSFFIFVKKKFKLSPEADRHPAFDLIPHCGTKIYDYNK